MAEASKPAIGTIGWVDLTVGNADEVRDFYREVAGWAVSPVDMGGYNDYCMVEPGNGSAIAGVCHARGANADLPPQWLIYITVADLDGSLARCRERGGSVVHGPTAMGARGRYAVVRDPAGAAAALFEPAAG
ncbi:MAG TPA: VOC family protein [Thermoanaerobaculia bacterium]|nr:VOC family protein [Thermoanaerobaculia bacterium]